MSDPADTIRLYFSFRSPYSWLAFVRIGPALTGLPVALEYLPVFPPPNYPNDPTAVPNKVKYITHDVARLAEAYGFGFKMPEKVDCEWVRPHAAFLYALDQGKAVPFGRGLFEARFVHGRDVGDDGVMAEVASGHGLDAGALVAAAADAAYQTRVVQGMINGVQQDSIFGVPYFVYRGERFWGNDRIDWLVRAIRRAHGMPVVDLSRDFLQPLDR
jgi:2-hydroxychromene-2-carboxylate isomerase